MGIFSSKQKATAKRRAKMFPNSTRATRKLRKTTRAFKKNSARNRRRLQGKKAF